MTQDEAPFVRALSRLCEAPDAEQLDTLFALLEQRAPEAPDVWTWAGLAAAAHGQAPRAETAYKAALTRDPTASVARHNLATLYRQNGEEQAALSVLGDPLGGPLRPETLVLQAHLHADLGAFDEALQGYEQALSLSPTLLDAHESLSRMLPQLGRAQDALNSYRLAIQRCPSDRALWASAITAAKDLRQGPYLVALADAACERFGASPDLLVALALGQAMEGQKDVAIAQLQRVIAAVPDHIAAHLHLIPLLLEQGDLRTAETCAVHATQLDPLDQSGWSWLTVIWRLSNDAREAWLADYDRFVVKIDLEEALSLTDGVSLPLLQTTLDAVHRTSHHPLEQSPRGGTQSRGDLFARSELPLRQFKAVIKREIDRVLDGLPFDPLHPFLGRRSSAGFSFAGAWSVRLRTGGYHAHHIHHKGWISSAFYVSLPPSVAHGREEAGALVFGVPELETSLNLSARRTLAPKEGQLVLFPSYFWHGTLPFDDEVPRVSIAFDMVPA